MGTVVISIAADQITDWPSFHDVFKHALGFPDFYGRNMDAWIDCMTSVDSAADRLTTVTVPHGELLVLKIEDLLGFKRRCLEQYSALIEWLTPGTPRASSNDSEVDRAVIALRHWIGRIA
jgi:hypothetical protein